MSQGDEKNRIPAWLRHMSGWEDTPEWLLRFIERAEGVLPADEFEGSLAEMGFGAPEGFSVGKTARRDEMPKEPPPLADATDISDWLGRLDEGAQAESEPPALAQDQGSDWLAGLDEAALTEVGATAPSEEESALDWLVGLEGGESAESEPAVSGEQTMPDGSVGPERETSAEEEPAVSSLEGDVPDWLAGLEEGGPPAAGAVGPVEEEGALDWLAGLEEGAPPAAGPFTPTEEGAVPGWLAELEGVPEASTAGELPDWLVGLEEGGPRAAEPLLPIQEQVPSDRLDGVPAERPPAEEGVPAEPEDVLDRLTGLDQGAPAEAAAETPAPVPSEEEALPDWLAAVGAEGLPAEEGVPAEPEDVLDWLTGLDQGAPAEAAAETPAPAPSEEEALPDWLAGVGAEGLHAEEAAPAEPEGIPDWLTGLDQGAPAEAAAETPAPAPSEEEALPDWLAAVDREGPPAEEGVPAEPEDVLDRLTGLDQGALPEAAAAQETGVPSEARSLSEAEAADLSEAGDRDEGPVPEWLQSVGEMPTEAEPGATKGVTAWLQEIRDMHVPEEIISEGPLEDDRIPEWLRDVQAGAAVETGQGGVDAGMQDWLEEMPPLERTVQGAPSRGEGSPPSQPPQAREPLRGSPSWMQELYTEGEEGRSDKDALVLSQEGPAAGETPAWLDELRDREAKTSEEQLPLETSGPLAGLRGVLNPEPLLAILPKATYRPVPPVTEADLAQVKLIEQMLAAPVSRPAGAPRSAGREIMASLGRWVLYIALLATILLSPLQSWVRPPDQLETRAFFNTIEGLSPGSTVLLVVDYDASLDGELTPQTRAVIWHLLNKNLGVAAISLTPQGVAIVEDLFAENRSAVAGEHYINLGYMPAHPAALQAFLSSPSGGAALFGTTLEPAQTSLGQRISRFEDLDLIITVSGDPDHVRWLVEQVGSQTQTDILASVSMGAAPYVQPYYSDMGNGQIKGVMAGLGAAARYEELAGASFAPSARPNFVVQANAQVLLVLVVLLGGLASLFARSTRQRSSSAPVLRAPASGDE